MHSSTNPCVLLLPYLDSWIYILVILVHYILIHIPRTSIKKLRESTRGTSDRENCEDTHKPSQSVPTFSGLVMHKVLLNLYSNKLVRKTKVSTEDSNCNCIFGPTNYIWFLKSLHKNVLQMKIAICDENRRYLRKVMWPMMLELGPRVGRLQTLPYRL